MQLQLGSWRSVGNGGCRGKRWKKKSFIKAWGNTATILEHEARLSKYTFILLVHVCSHTSVCVIIRASKAKFPFDCELAGSSRGFHPIPSTFWASLFGHTRS